MNKLIYLFAIFIFITSIPTVIGAVSCGDTITTNTNLTSDLTECSSNGLTIGGDDVTLDCQGNMIDGVNAANSTGVNNTGGYNNFTMRNCIIKNFEYGLR
ncbi:MAG: hypothetical protein ABEK17_04635, partial [Candidatus Aenigmatarchaeota archaeon]